MTVLQTPRSWAFALVGLFLAVFAVLALSGPGRIDIDDGQLRYEVAKNLADHGEPTIRDPKLWFTVLPGRDGKRYTMCRFPHSLLGLGAILLADATGAATDARRHFFFSMVGAGAGAALAVLYAIWFRRVGSTPGRALAWAAAGIFCTQSWYYSTSTFDDIFGAGAIVAAVMVAFLWRECRPLAGAILAGFLTGLAFNCKQPLGLFVLPVLAAVRIAGLEWKRQARLYALVALGLAAGLFLYEAYEWYKFPPETRAAHGPILERWKPTWAESPLPGILGLTVSVGAGALWYCPTLLLSWRGLMRWSRTDKPLVLAIAVSSAGLVLFLSFLNFFKGDLAWGPRYLTPVFALLWLFVPAGAATVGRHLVALLLGAGLLVQVLALGVDPHRLYLQRNLWSCFYVVQPWLYFDPAISHVFNRPRELVEVLSQPPDPSAPYTPAPSPTYCFPILERIPGGAPSARRYQILNSLRPWWASQRYLPRGDRPVDLVRTAEVFFFLLAGGLGLVGWSLLSQGNRPISAVLVERASGKEWCLHRELVKQGETP